jgi:hypothetical protein
VIRSSRYWVPHWHNPSHWLAYWDVFSRPTTKPRYARGIPETWMVRSRKSGEAILGGTIFFSSISTFAAAVAQFRFGKLGTSLSTLGVLSAGLIKECPRH